MSSGDTPRGRWSGAAGLLGLSLALACAAAPTPSGPPARIDAQMALARGRSAAVERRWPAAARSFGHAADAFAALDELPAEASARREEAEALGRSGDWAAAATAGRRALTLDRDLGRREEAARDRAVIARSAAAQGDLASALRETEAARATVASGTPLAVVLDQDVALYRILRGAEGDLARAIELLEGARTTSEALGDARGVATSELHLGRAALAQGNADAAAPHLARALEEFRRLEDPEGLANTHELLGRLRFALGEDAAAQAELEQARAGFMYLGDRAGLARLERLTPPEAPAR